ncbi:hypothetical protein BGZ60DRAFT_544318 [Tricladium varicosporioides]|nr:hypothetical protein BGZ60DRAFT_544318 [Hymenoscyphus varicosporioides]
MSIEVLYDGTGPEGNLNPTVDIVAVHGLNPTNKDDHAVATWTDSKSGHLWLRDALPHSQPSARVLLYSYNSSPAFGNDKDRFIFQGNSLMECLRLIRRKALINAQNNLKYKEIKEATSGLMFFGTPHSGPTNDLKVKFGRVCVDIAQSMPWKASNDIMEALEKRSLFSDVLHEHWRHQLEQYQIISFYEGIGNLVPRESAVFGLDGRRENQVKLDAAHRDMCRFNPSVKKDMDNYFLVEGNIDDLCSKFAEFIDSLREYSYNPRLEKISKKHQESLQWIWKDDRDGPGFVQWLKSDVPIYWITGLPGSGKSTLMKYLYENPQTQSYIPTNGWEVTTIGYFFHELGTNTETGFKSLLSRILEALSAAFSTLASLYTVYFAELRKRLKSGPGKLPWHECHLEKALELITLSDASGNVLLFVDGLDECSGDHRKQLEFLVPWIRSTQGKSLTIRMCISSRPLQEIGLRLSDFPSCRIHEWTANDISAFVRDKLGQTQRTLTLSDQKPHIHHNGEIINYLTKEVIGKAQGVFLWVELVVNNLIVGLEEGFSDTELKDCLDSLPPELENLYARIFEQIPKDYMHDAMIYFGLVLRCHSVGLLDFYLATRDPKEALARENQWSHENHLTIKHACARVEARIKSRCRGLLHVKQTENHKTASHYTPSEKQDVTPLASLIGINVEFLHLSVRDYIASQPFATPDSFWFKISISFMVSSINLLKLLQPDQLFQFRPWDYSTSETPYKFSPLMDYTGKNDELEYRFSGFKPIESLFIHARLTDHFAETYQRRLLAELNQTCSLANKNWHSLYLESALENYGSIPVRIPDLVILQLLLRRGANPNEVFDRKTSWEYALLAINHLLDNCKKMPKNWTEPLMVLLEHGAIPNQYTDDGESVLEVVSKHLDEDTWLLDGTKELIRALIHRGLRMKQETLEWVGVDNGQQIKIFIEKTQEEKHGVYSGVIETGL